VNRIHAGSSATVTPATREIIEKAAQYNFRSGAPGLTGTPEISRHRPPRPPQLNRPQAIIQTQMARRCGTRTPIAIERKLAPTTIAREGAKETMSVFATSPECKYQVNPETTIATVRPNKAAATHAVHVALARRSGTATACFVTEYCCRADFCCEGCDARSGIDRLRGDRPSCESPDRALRRELRRPCLRDMRLLARRRIASGRIRSAAVRVRADDRRVGGRKCPHSAFIKLYQQSGRGVNINH